MTSKKGKAMRGWPAHLFDLPEADSLRERQARKARAKTTAETMRCERYFVRSQG
jgi:hypothetical protein